MKQIAFLIDVAWLQDEETTVAFRFGGLQLITTWPPDTCKFGYLLFNSEASRAQKVEAAGFFKPTTNAVEEFEAKLSEGIASSRKADSVSQIETLRWAVSRSITDLGWHAVSVTSPVKASRKRRQNIQRLNEPESRNMLFLFSRLPPGSLTKIRDELVTPSLGKCLQENRIELFWAHDSLQQSQSTSSNCVFLRIRDLVQLCGVFPTEQLQYSASLGPRSKIVSFLLQRSKSQPLAKCELSMNNLFNPIELSIFSNQSEPTATFDCGGRELEFDGLQQDPTVTSILEKSVAIFIATSLDVHFHRLLMELRSLNSVCFLKCDETKLFLLKPMADSVAALVQITKKDLAKDVESESSVKLFDTFYLEKSCPAEPSNDEVSLPTELLSRIQSACKSRKSRKVKAPEIDLVQERSEGDASMSFQEEPSIGGFTSEESLLQQMRFTHERAMTGRLSTVVAAQSIVAATVHFFENDVARIKTFLLENFPVPLQSNRPSEEWANECLIFTLISFELVSLSPTEADSVRADVVNAMRKMLFLTSPSKLFDFIQETLKNLYIETARPLLEDIADTFDSPLVADSDDDIELPGSSISSLPEPLSGISSLGSANNSVPHSVPTKPKPAVGGDPLRRMSSANLSQRQIQIPKRRNVKEQPSSSTTSPVKRASTSRGMPTTPRGRRILKTQVVPETPVGKQAPGRVRRTQETLRRQSSILNNSSQGEEDAVMEVDESPSKGTPVKITPEKTPRTTPLKTPRTSPRKHLTRKLMFSPQKKTFTSPTAISLLHLTTSPVLFKPGRRKPT